MMSFRKFCVTKTKEKPESRYSFRMQSHPNNVEFSHNHVVETLGPSDLYKLYYSLQELVQLCLATRYWVHIKLIEVQLLMPFIYDNDMP